MLATPTNLPSIAVSPAVSTVAPRGVVQLSATVSTGDAVTWSVLSADGGQVNSTGTYTAPVTPGVYVVEARVGGRVALATIVVQ
jgi:hypothetical protein